MALAFDPVVEASMPSPIPAKPAQTRQVSTPALMVVVAAMMESRTSRKVGLQMAFFRPSLK